MNRSKFFSGVRSGPFPGKITQSQVDGMSAILSEWDKRKLNDLRWLAYILATAFWETARTMQPIREIGKGKGRKYGVKGKHGQIAYGRGYVQLTHDYNYEIADKKLGLKGDLIRNYDLALQPSIASAIMFDGMIDGWFTGRRLAQFFNNQVTDWINARRIINGTDKAKEIAAIAKQFYADLISAG